jgi:TPR repeat protein
MSSKKKKHAKHKHPHHHHHHDHTHLYCCAGAGCGHCDCCKHGEDDHEEEKEHHEAWWRNPGFIKLMKYMLWLWSIIIPVLLVFFLLWDDDVPYRALATDEAPYDTAATLGPASPASSTGGATPDFDTDASGALIPEIKIDPIDLSKDTEDEGDKDAGPSKPPISAGNLERHVDLAIQEADGSRIAAELRWQWLQPEGVWMSSEERERVRKRFVDKSETQGVRGFYRLGLTYLGDLAFSLAKEDRVVRKLPDRQRLFVPYSPRSSFVPATDHKRAYFYLALAQECNVSRTELYTRWMNAIATRNAWSTADTKKLRDLAFQRYYDETEKKSHIEYCTGFADILPPCVKLDNARQALKLGDAELAKANLTEARICWRKAIELGKSDPDGTQSAIIAQKRLQTNTLTCKHSPESLAAISRDYRARSGDLIRMEVIQQALAALGHYDGPLNGQLDLQTRAGIRKFQREMEFDETDMLNPYETTVLMCNAAETAHDVASQNALGVMYAVGLGVDQNIDQALEWLRRAAAGSSTATCAVGTTCSADAKFNLSVLYGTGIILKSYRLCDAPRSPEQAQQYLEEAAMQQHPIAVSLMAIYGPGSKFATLTPAQRWGLIEQQQLQNSAADKTGLYGARLANIGTKCSPDRSIKGEGP